MVEAKSSCALENAQKIVATWTENPDTGVEEDIKNFIVFASVCAIDGHFCKVLGDIISGKLTNIRTEITSDSCDRK